MKRISNALLCEAESFRDYGGWTLDSQFEEEMGSPYLLAHGMGQPVADAVTTVSVKEAGSYHVWVRTKDWVPEYHPGRFSLLINGTQIGGELGAHGGGWNWQHVGEAALPAGEVTLTLHDLTGFEGRCDAIYLTPHDDVPPEEGKQVDRSWRKKLLGLPADPENAGEFDVVVVGGGMAGCAAALTAARTGSTVALITDRPVLGGNASKEIGLGPRGYLGGKLVPELVEREPDGNMRAQRLLRNESRVSIFYEERIYGVQMKDGFITAVDARNSRTSRESRFTGKVFIDCSGKAAVAERAGAEIRTGREGWEEFHEGLAPEKPDDLHHGHTILYHMHMADHPVSFPEVPWATAVARDFDSLDGQMGGLSIDNQFGPTSRGDRKLQNKMKTAANFPGMLISLKSNHELPRYKVMNFFPATHFWEYGQDMDLRENEEEIRDHLLRALYGTFSNIKKAQPQKYANLEFEWLRFLPASGEYGRIMGDYIVNENEVREHAEFQDAIVQNDSAICIHCAVNPQYDFRLTSWIWDVRDRKPYWLPFRSLYSKDVPNLLMAGKQISVSRVVGCNTKLMSNGAEHGVAAGCAATLCCQRGITPREIYQSHMAELRELVAPFE